MSDPQPSPPGDADDTSPAPPEKAARAVAVVVDEKQVVEPAPTSAPMEPEPRGLFARLERKARRWLAPKPINRKLTAITMLACTAALVFSGIIFFTFDIVTQFLSSRTALQSLSRVAAENTRDALARGSSQTVVTALNALMDYPHVTGAMVYRADGRPFARPTKHVKAVLPGIMESSAPMGTHLGISSLSHYEPVMHDNQRVGTIAIEIALSELWTRLRLYAAIMLGVFILASLAARLLLGRLQGMISEPVVALARVADTVAKDKDYTLRAEKRSDDEVGHLVETFNNMLAEVQKRDAALNQAHTDLETNVTLRTSELHNEITERRQAEEALKDSEARYRNLFENNPVPMFVMDLESLGFIAVNNAATRHYGYGQSEFLLLSLPAITREADPLDIERAFRSNAKSFDAGEWKHKKRNGEVIEVQLTAHAISFAGKIAKIVLATDVTERNRAQRELDEMHKKLVEASRAAGMAEVATGVLHNVGNVLNSVNVSASLLGDSVRKSKTASIRKVAELLESNRDDLASFFGPNGKGQMMPTYLATLAQQIDAEQQSRLAEIEQLTKNIAHIKDIVAMQQDYAKVAGVMEDFAPRTLIDEALRVTNPELQRCSVSVEIDCPPALPKVNTDRHKVLQILVNLITNAHQAMDALPPSERCLKLSAACGNGGRVRIAVADNGCGIPKENLTRVFNHGFTTKSGGHGFGLHSAANAATEVGGSLSGASEGPGKGAVFVLELPLAQPDAAKKAA